MTRPTPAPGGERRDGEDDAEARGGDDAVAAEPAMDRQRLPDSAAAARSRVRHALMGRPGPAPAREVVDDVLLVVTELVTNALRHGGGITAFDVLHDGDTVTLRVGDASTTPPRTVPRTDPAAPGGFGWPLVQRLCRRVTVTAAADGKTIEVVMGTLGRQV
ncbi:ATP-binding protein [Streptomyces sp. NPDC006458]|uniref:ATP-binding protein n=1 Tax=Streptomyces sp. NPDC006458 TaxID=3154302 RepID=UPI0033A9156D